MTDSQVSKSDTKPPPLPEWHDWLPLVFAGGAWFAAVLLVLISAADSGALRKLILLLEFAALVSAVAAIVDCVALIVAGRRSWKAWAGGFAALLWFGGVLLMPHLCHRGCRENAYRTKCISNIKQIALACRLYANDNAGAFPPALGTLYPGIVANSWLFACPIVGRDGHLRATRSDAFVPDAVCYAYVSGLRATDDADFVLAFDEEWNHGGEGANILRVDAKVYWICEVKHLHSELEAQRAALAAKRREMRVIRPPWSRWPDPPDYPVRPWHERPWAAAVVGAAAALAVGVVTLVLVKRRRVAAQKGDA